MRVFVGVDPGGSGGIAAVNEVGGYIFADKFTKVEQEVSDLFDIHSRIPIGVGVRAVIEKVHAMPKQGVSSTFKFGQSYGFLRSCLICYKIPFDEVTPQKWQRALGVPKKTATESKTDYKNRLKNLACNLFPEVKVTHAIADALLLAEYLRRLEMQK